MDDVQVVDILVCEILLSLLATGGSVGKSHMEQLQPAFWIVSLLVLPPLFKILLERTRGHPLPRQFQAFCRGTSSNAKRVSLAEVRQKIGHDGFFQIEGTNKSTSYFLIARGQTEALLRAGEVVDLHVDDSKFNMIFSPSITRPARAPTENKDEGHTDFGRIVLSASAKTMAQ